MKKSNYDKLMENNNYKSLANNKSKIDLDEVKNILRAIESNNKVFIYLFVNNNLYI